MSQSDWMSQEGVPLFGVRHFSPAGAWHLRRFLDERKPKLVLVEGPQDANPLLELLCDEKVKLPVALLAYSLEPPVTSIVFPFCEYSPEYQAILWAKEHQREARFFDLSSSYHLPLYLQEHAFDLTNKEEESLKKRISFISFQHNLYQELAQAGGEEDFDTYWERQFEHDLSDDGYHQLVNTFSNLLRQKTAEQNEQYDPFGYRVNELREAHMKKCIVEAIESGIQPDQIVVVCGAYHVSGLINNQPLKDFEDLSEIQTRMTLMPYSNFRLSSLSGYGAGNNAPQYYELMYECYSKNQPEELPALYLSKLNHALREKHGYSSTASLIECVRLAKALQYLHEGQLPTLKDLHDAALTILASGDPATISEALVAVDFGTRIGALPDKSLLTPIQLDMNRQLEELNLKRFLSPVAENLKLDLRENLRVQNEKSAFLDLRRSTFFHRLRLCGIHFATQVPLRQDGASWAESWNLVWSPEMEIVLVENILYGDTIQIACENRIRESLDKANNVVQLSELIDAIMTCQLDGCYLQALARLQQLTAQSLSFTHLAAAAKKIADLLEYGSLRHFDTKALEPLLTQLFLKAALYLYSGAACDDKSAREICGNLGYLHQITQGQSELVDDEIWLNEISRLARADDRNPLLSGFAVSLLMERNRFSANDLDIQISRYLSAANSSESGARWFEGLLLRNRLLFLSQLPLWHKLDDYLQTLDEEEFTKALICLRRAFSAFSAREKDSICDILGEAWGFENQSIAELLQADLQEDELSKLNDFDFEDVR